VALKNKVEMEKPERQHLFIYNKSNAMRIAHDYQNIAKKK